MLRQKPKGIVVLSVGAFVLAAAVVLGGGLFAVAPGTLQSFGFPAYPELGQRFLLFLTLVAGGIVMGFVGYGLLQLKPWGRNLALYLSIVLVVSELADFFTDSAEGWLSVTSLLVGVTVLWYLSTARVKSAFRPPESSETAP